MFNTGSSLTVPADRRRKAHQQRNPHRLFVRGHFLEPAVIAQEVSVVPGEDENRLVQPIRFFKRLADAADVVVERDDAAIIVAIFLTAS